MKKINAKSKFLLFVGLFLLTTSLSAQNPNRHIYLCFGQSNMEGQGTIEDQDNIVDSRFQVFQVLDCPNLGREKTNWYTAIPPLCLCTSGLSPADYFGRTMVANLPDSIEIGVINVAIGGCDIRLFDKDIYQEYDSTVNKEWFYQRVADYGGNPYQYLIDHANMAKQDGVIKGILLHQGETNGGDSNWPSYVKKIYNDMLTDLSLSADSTPLLAGELLSTPDACCSGMNRIINRLPDTIPNAHIISSSGCEGRDKAHFNSEGYRILGSRYGVKMLSLMGKETVYSEAECGIVGDNLKIMDDENASNGNYVTVDSSNKNNADTSIEEVNAIQMDFTISADTNYYVYGRFNNSTTSDNSYWIKIDNGEYELIEEQDTTGWHWLALNNYSLLAGEHTLYIAISGDGGSLDKIAIKNSPITPVNFGEEANNICDPSIPSGIDSNNEKSGYNLEQNKPNPFSGITNISFEIPNTTFVSLKVFDMQGQEVAELAGKQYSSGKHTVAFSLEKTSVENYIYKIEADNFSDTKKMIQQAE